MYRHAGIVITGTIAHRTIATTTMEVLFKMTVFEEGVLRKYPMPIRLDTIIKKIERMSNRVNCDLLKDFYQHMKDNGTSQNYQKGNLKATIHFAEHFGEATSVYNVDYKQIVRFLDTKIKPE
jgi:hypothetical protein